MDVKYLSQLLTHSLTLAINAMQIFVDSRNKAKLECGAIHPCNKGAFNERCWNTENKPLPGLQSKRINNIYLLKENFYLL